jgi:hypothetical protein
MRYNRGAENRTQTVWLEGRAADARIGNACKCGIRVADSIVARETLINACCIVQAKSAGILVIF